MQSDPLEFLQWFLNALHIDLGGTKKANSSIIYQVFQGEVQVTTETPKKDEKKEETKPEGIFSLGFPSLTLLDMEFTTSTKTAPFLFLSLEIPPTPLFKDEQEKNIIPQVAILSVHQHLCLY